MTRGKRRPEPREIGQEITHSNSRAESTPSAHFAPHDLHFLRDIDFLYLNFSHTFKTLTRHCNLSVSAKMSDEDDIMQDSDQEEYVIQSGWLA